MNMGLRFPSMTVRVKILASCAALTMLTALMGAYSRNAQHGLGTVTIRLYDDVFQAMSYLRSAQIELTRAEAELRKTTPGETLATAAQRLQSFTEVVHDTIANIQVARARGLSDQARQSAQKLAGMAAVLLDCAARQDWPGLYVTLDEAGPMFDTAVEVYAADGYRYRKDADAIIRQSEQETWAATVIAVLIAIAITIWLSRSIIPVLLKAVKVAEAIASGRLDNTIVGHERDETGLLLSALNVMQTSIAAGMSRLDAALSNMSQGLCLFGTDGRLLISNVQFAAMFGAPKQGAVPAQVFATEELAQLLINQANTEARFSRELSDGRFIAVTHSPVQGGGWVATFEDVTIQQRDAARIAHMAHHDALTGLPNRVLFREHLHHALARVQTDDELAVFYLDLDRFKPVNDTLGHQMGDAVLHGVSDRLRSCVRKTDLVARLGGDEFAIVQEKALQPTDATALAQRLLAAIGEPFEIEGHHIVIGTSIGIALAGNGQSTADSLLKSADLALYRAKTNGRGAWAFFEPEMDARMQARRLLETDLRAAMSGEQFKVFYQPLIETVTNSISGFEALIRWHHPKRGMISPAEFIPLAEEIGLIREIGAWVLRRSCTDLLSWPTTFKVAVNLSPLQFRDIKLVEEVALIVSETGLDPSRLELEVTEGVMLGNDQTVLTILHGLRGIGVKIAMDDFGTGYSSLSYLRRFPFDKIKIDQSFVRELEVDGDCTSIIRAVVGLGRSLGMLVNAEGVETEKQFATLRAEGCNEVQGYLFSKPIPASEIPMLLEKPSQTRFESLGHCQEAAV